MNKLSSLEVCRFLSAVAVLVWHYQHFFVNDVWTDTVAWSQREAFPLYALLMPFYQYGWIAVQIFWTISGYIFFLKYGETIKHREIGPSLFFLLRFSRLYPMHIATLIIVAVLQVVYFSKNGVDFIYSHNDVIHFAEHLAMASNWLQSQPNSFNGPIWSISTEVVIYAAFFFICRLPVSNILICTLVPLLCQIAYHFYPDNKLSCATLFFLGGLISITIASDKRAINQWAFGTASVVFLLLITLLARGHFMSNNFVTGLSVSFFIMMLTLDRITTINLDAFAWLGNLTYSSYLLHFPLQLVFKLASERLGYDKSVFYSPAALISWLATTFWLAWLAYRFFEMPAQAAIRSAWGRFKARPKAQAA